MRLVKVFLMLLMLVPVTSAIAQEKKVDIKLGGQYRVMANASNFDWHPTTLTDRQDSQNFFNQRFRTWIAVIPNNEVEAYFQAEMGHVTWGSNFEWPKTYAGPRYPASTDPNGDRVGIELRRGYLTYKRADIGTFRVGIQDWHDGFGGMSTMDSSRAVDDYDSFGAVLANSIWDFNVGGVSFNRKFPEFSNLDLNLGTFIIWEADAKEADEATLYALDADVPVDTKNAVGLSLYYLNDQERYSYPSVSAYRYAWDLWIGLRGKTEISSIPLNGFVIFNTGERNNMATTADFEHDGWAAKLEAGAYSLGPGKLSVQTLISTGDDNPNDNDSDEFRTIAQSERDNFGSQGYWSYLAITSPHPPGDVNDLGVGLQNRGLGLSTIQAKYELQCPFIEKMNHSIAVGWLQSREDNPTSREKDIGTEIAKTSNFDLGGGMTLAFGCAYLFTGDFYKTSPTAKDPDNLWELFIRMQLEF